MYLSTGGRVCVYTKHGTSIKKYFVIENKFYWTMCKNGNSRKNTHTHTLNNSNGVKFYVRAIFMFTAIQSIQFEAKLSDMKV